MDAVLQNPSASTQPGIGAPGLLKLLLAGPKK
jgi:hypothetical protein